MTKRREWPNAAAHQRNRAAEEVEFCIRKLALLNGSVQNGQFTRAGLERDLMALHIRLQTAARHLQAAGAPIEPE